MSMTLLWCQVRPSHLFARFQKKPPEDPPDHWLLRWQRNFQLDEFGHLYPGRDTRLEEQSRGYSSVSDLRDLHLANGDRCFRIVSLQPFVGFLKGNARTATDDVGQYATGGAVGRSGGRAGRASRRLRPRLRGGGPVCAKRDNENDNQGT